jgi:hypothetical protein
LSSAELEYRRFNAFRPIAVPSVEPGQLGLAERGLRLGPGCRHRASAPSGDSREEQLGLGR